MGNGRFVAIYVSKRKLREDSGSEWEYWRTRSHLELPFIGIDDLLVNKEASGGAKDLIDLPELRRIKDGSDSTPKPASVGMRDGAIGLDICNSDHSTPRSARGLKRRA